MIKEEQIKLVEDLTTSIKESMIYKINQGSVPENWDGFEIRHWLWKIADFEDIWSDKIRNKPWRKRIKDCNNDLIVKNLY